MVNIPPIPPPPNHWKVSSGNETLKSPKNIDFQKFKAVAMACDNGATIPSAPVVGQWFLHTPIGRKILYQFDGSNWIPMASYGITTLYVDPTNGTDDISHGTATGADAFKTWQFAYNTVNNGAIGGNIIINVVGTDTNTLNMGGGSTLGAFTIDFVGTTTTQVNTTATGGTTGNATTQATIVKTLAGWTVDAFRGMWIKFTSGLLNNEIRVIETNTSDTITVAGSIYSSAPQNGDSFIIYDSNTILSGNITILPSTAKIRFFNVKLTGHSNFDTVSLYRQECVIKDCITNECVINDFKCFIDVSQFFLGEFSFAMGGYLKHGGTYQGDQGFAYSSNSATLGFYVLDWASFSLIRQGTAIKNFFLGLYSRGLIELSNIGLGISTNVFIKNNNTGLFAQWNGAIATNAQVTFSGNVTDANPAIGPLSPAWIGS